VRQRTMLANALRGHLGEFGVIGAKGIRRLSELVPVLHRSANYQT
jgi:transposase